MEQTRLDYDNDLIDGARYKAKTAKLQAQLDRAEVLQARLMAALRSRERSPRTIRSRRSTRHHSARSVR